MVHEKVKKYLFYLLIFTFVFLPCIADEKAEKELKEWRESRIKETKNGWVFNFEEDEDNNGFPDNWSRSKNYKLSDGKTLAFASWAEIKLDSKNKKDGQYSLYIYSQGAQPIGIETDVFKIDNNSAYELSSWFNLDPESTPRTSAILGIYWYDKDLNLLPQKTEDRFTVKHTTGWENIKQRINLIHNNAIYARIYLRVEGDDPEGKIWVDETKFYKRPRISIETNKFLHIFNENEPFTFQVKIRGLEKSSYSFDVNITDVYNNKIFKTSKDFSIKDEDLEQKNEISFTINPNDKSAATDKDKLDKLHLLKGAFTVNVTLFKEGDEIGGNSARIGRTKLQHRIRIKDDGEIFGVTVDNLNNAFQLRKGLDLIGLLRVKIPVWDTNLEWAGAKLVNEEPLNKLTEIVKEVRSGDNQPEIVGVFAPRPKSLENIADKGILNLVNSDESLWKLYFENAIYGFRTNIKTWQLGDDQDSSFTNDSKQQQALDKLTPYLEKAGQIGGTTKILNYPIIADKKLLNHRWLSFNDFEYTDSLKFDAIDKIISNEEGSFAVKKWLTIPLKSKLLFRNDLSPAIDVFKKIVWARKNNIRRIFISNYQDEFCGLINQKNEITPALITYKLGIDLLSEVTYMGSLPEFGDEIENFVFSLNHNPKKAILVAWSKRSDLPNKSYEFTESKLIKLNKSLENLSEELKKPDVILNHQITQFIPDLIFDKSRSHYVKGLNTIINSPSVRKSFLAKYAELGKISKSPALQELINNKYKKEDEEKETARFILEEIYPNTLYQVDIIQKNILLDQDIEQIDLMGNSTPVIIKWNEGDPYQEIKINQYPTIFTGLSSDFINTRISIRLDERFPLFSRLEKQKQVIIIKNYYDQPMDGIFIINYPSSWKNFSPFVPFHLEKSGDKGDEQEVPFYITPSRIATPGPIDMGLKTIFTTNKKYTFRSERETTLQSDLVVGKPDEKIVFIPPKLGDTSGKHTLNIPISLKQKNGVPNRPSEIDVVVTLDFPDGESLQFRVDKIQAGTYRMAPFSHKLKKEYNNKVAKVRIEQRGGNTESLIFHNLDIPIPDTE